MSWQSENGAAFDPDKMHVVSESRFGAPKFASAPVFDKKIILSALRFFAFYTAKVKTGKAWIEQYSFA
jgi:hypothetical protein